MSVMQDVATPLESVASSAVGRRVLTCDGAWFTPGRHDGVSVFDSAGAEFVVGDLVVMPVLGERVSLATPAGAVVGWWLSHDELPDGAVRASVLTATGVQQVQVAARVADIRLASHSEQCPPDLRVALEAVVTTAASAQLAERMHQRRIDDLVMAAHEEATEQGWCSQFDDFMENQGLPRRDRDYEVTVEVPVTVTVTVTAKSSEDAEEMVGIEDVWQALTRDNIDMGSAEISADY